MSIDRVHIVYPHGQKASTPDAIGRELGERLGRDLDVVFHDWTGFESIPPSPRAALVGHAHPIPGTTFRRSARRPGWGRRVMLQPFVTEIDQVGYIAGVLPHVDHIVAITGRHWQRLLQSSRFAPIEPMFTQLDLAVRPEDFPFLVDEGRPPGERRILYVGRDVPVKNLGYLEEIARRRTAWTFAHIGPPGAERPGIEQLGPLDFREPASLELVASFDLLVTVGRADANPTTVLEAMAWGLVPVCTPESGYEGYDGIANIPLGDPDAAVAVLDQLQEMPSSELARIRIANRQRIEQHYTWDRFASVVRSAIDGDDGPDRPPQLSRWVRWGLTARWWLTAPLASNRAGLTDSLRKLVSMRRP